jgi:penicillin-binding protein 1A
MSRSKPWLSIIFYIGCTGAAMGVAVALATVLYLTPALPSADQLRDVHLQVPLKIYSHDGHLIGEFGEQRRTPVSFDQIPTHFVHAIIAAEDDRFFSHQGVDLMGLLRAASQILTTGGIQSGGSTITMQVARNFFLTLDQTFTRKFNEILLALQIERELTKEEILELYANKMFLGKRAYGIQAAAQVYYGKNVNELSLSQLAMIAGTYQLPSAVNPINNPRRAMDRRNWILGRMLFLGYIDQATHNAAIAEPDTASDHGTVVEINAPYVAEMVRREMLDRFGTAAYENGYEVYTTIDVDMQRSASDAVREGLLTYDQRHGYRGPERRMAESVWTDREASLDLLNRTPVYGGLEPALITAVNEQSLIALMRNGQEVEIGWDQGLSTLLRYRTQSWQDQFNSIDQIASAGDLIRLRQINGTWQFSQLPNVQGAMVALDPSNGAIRALTGGFDYYQSNFNRVTDSRRQPGSNLKPFLYATALEHGYTPASIINDAAIVFEDAALEDIWRPENDSGRFYGPTRFREALYQSRNLVSIRILRSVGVGEARQGIMRFGFEDEDLPYNLTLALGSGGVAPLKIAGAYSVFANGGYKVEPHLIDHILDVEGQIVYQSNAPSVCHMCTEEEVEEQQDILALEEANPEDFNIPNPAKRVIDPRVAYITDDILKDVIKLGTGRRALALEREDIGGKTGTTNGPRDAWFSGYSPHLVATAWVGFDDNSLLGSGEFGGTAALPIWINFMRDALADKPEYIFPQPPGIITARINLETGERAQPNDTNADFEIFLRENAPPLPTGGETNNATGNDSRGIEDIF